MSRSGLWMSMGAIAFHEKAGRSQVGCFVFSLASRRRPAFSSHLISSIARSSAKCVYDSACMKRWLLLTAALVVIALSVVGVRYELEKRAHRKRELEKLAQEKREVVYQSALHSYSEGLRPGMTRKEVEDYLRAKHITFGQSCCVDPKDLPKGVYDDLTKIGQDEAPWFCSANIVYVAFRFTGPERHSVGWTAEASDTLKAVTVYRRLEGCL
jgi:hypothetical protein